MSYEHLAKTPAHLSELMIKHDLPIEAQPQALVVLIDKKKVPLCSLRTALCLFFKEPSAANDAAINSVKCFVIVGRTGSSFFFEKQLKEVGE